MAVIRHKYHEFDNDFESEILIGHILLGIK